MRTILLRNVLRIFFRVRLRGVTFTISLPFLYQDFVFGGKLAGSAFPNLDLIVVFVSGDLRHRAAELDLAGSLLDLAAEAAGQGEQLRRG